jgi:hypothetical protein
MAIPTVSVKKLFDPVFLPATSDVIITIPALNTMPNGKVRVNNTTGLARQVTLFAVVGLGPGSAVNEFFSAQVVPPAGFIDVDVPVLQPGDSLMGFCDVAGAVSIHFMGGVLYSG